MAVEWWDIRFLRVRLVSSIQDYFLSRLSGLFIYIIFYSLALPQNSSSSLRSISRSLILLYQPDSSTSLLTCLYFFTCQTGQSFLLIFRRSFCTNLIVVVALDWRVWPADVIWFSVCPAWRGGTHGSLQWRPLLLLHPGLYERTVWL